MAVSLSITLAQGTQDVANNRTYVTAKVYATSTNGSYNNNSKSGYLILDGTNYSFSSSFAKNATTLLYSVGKWCSHDTVGKKTVSASASFVTGVSSGTITASASLALSTIARPTTPSLSSGSVALGESVTINLPRKSSAFTHNVTYKIGSASGTIATGAGTSCTWVVPKSLADQIASSTSGTVTISVATVYNGSSIGTKTITLAVTVPDDTEYNPELSISVSDPAGYKDVYGYYLVGYSRYKVAMTETTKHGATIKSRSTSMNGTAYSSLNPESGVISSVGDNSIISTVIDSRGRKATASVESLPTRVYAKPQITAITVPVRCLADGTPYEDGDYIKASMAFSHDSIDGKNAVSAKIKARPRIFSEYTAEAAVSSGQQVILPANHNYTYYVSYEVVDSLNQKDGTTYQLNTHDAVLSSKLGYKLAIGKAAELGTPDKPVFESAWYTVLPGMEAQSAEVGSLEVGSIDYTITDAEFDELLNLLGGGQ